MNRRSFFHRTIGAVAAAVVTQYIPVTWKWKFCTNQATKPITFGTASFVLNDGLSPNTLIGIDRTAFKFWGNVELCDKAIKRRTFRLLNDAINATEPGGTIIVLPSTHPRDECRMDSTTHKQASSGPCQLPTMLPRVGQPGPPN